MSEVLGYNMVSARWVRKQLTDEHKKKRVHMCHIKRSPYSMNLAGILSTTLLIAQKFPRATTTIFPAFKKVLGGQRFKLDEEMQDAVDNWLRDAAGEWYDAGIKKLVARIQKVIDHQGNYVEK